MSKLPRPKEILRITLADEIPDIPGVYVLAYFGKIVYIGISEIGVMHRLQEHGIHADKTSELLGKWMIRCSDWENVRLDILVPPDGVDMRWWLKTTESTCIRRFIPLLNQQHATKYANEKGVSCNMMRAAHDRA